MDNEDGKVTIAFGEVIEIMDDKYYQQIVIMYMTIECEEKYQIHIVHDIKLLIAQFVSQQSVTV